MNFSLREGDYGPNVELLQSILKKLGFYDGKVDSNFGLLTKDAVLRFQKEFGLMPDGFVGKNTLNRLIPYINGYTYYIVQPGDTLYNIALKYNTNVNSILFANQNLDVNNLKVGEVIIVPFEEIVKTDISYTYNFMKSNLESLKIIYPFLQIGTIGRSVLNRPIPYMKIGRGEKQILYNSSIHANEWITASLTMKFIENFSKSYVIDGNIFGYKARNLFEQCSLYIIPMMNPDGVDLVTGYFKENDEFYNQAKKISQNYEEIPFPSGWKANIKGVDLNLQFPANWEEARNIKYEEGFSTPAPRDYVGIAPISQPEAVALYNFTTNNKFNLTISFHSQGKVIYWRYLDYLPEGSFEIAQEFSRVSGYELDDTPFRSSFAGYRDWFIQDFNKPGFTIEVGEGENPLPISQFNEIYSDIEVIFVLCMVM